MRRPVFDRWIKREIMDTAGMRFFNLRKLAALSQSSKPDIAAALLLYAYVTNRLDKLDAYIYRDALREEYDKVLAIISGRNIGLLALRKNPPAPLPSSYSDLLTAYKAAYLQPEAESLLKRERWEEICRLQREKGVTNAEIYRELKLDAGNTNAFLKHGNTAKVSLEATARILEFLRLQ